MNKIKMFYSLTADSFHHLSNDLAECLELGPFGSLHHMAFRTLFMM
jgi:hypothetical protein